MRCWVTHSRDSGGNLDLNNQSRSGRPVTAPYDLNSQKFNGLMQENRRISQTAIMKKLNTGSASVAENTEDSDYKKVCAGRVPRHFMPEMKRERL